MKKYYILTLIYFIYFQSFCQSQLRQYVQANTIPINSVKADYTDDSDLQRIANAIGEAKVVMLGEQAHGDGATFLAKSRLVKYLHEQKGFNVLAFESDFFGLNVGWEQLKKEREPIIDFLNNNIYKVWSNSKQCGDLLYNYIPNTYLTQKPLTVTGFDNQTYLTYSSNYLIDNLDNYLQQKDISFTRSKAYREEFLPSVESLVKRKLKEKEHEHELLALERNTSTILSQLDEYKKEYEWLLLKNIESYAAMTRTIKNLHVANEIRDKQMAANFEWLISEKYPNEKVIVWAANSHISKNATTAFKDKVSQRNWMGTVFASDSLNNASTYVIGFSSKSGYEGTALQTAFTKVNPPSKNGFEHWINRKHKYAFVDFKTFRNANPSFTEYFQMKGHGHINKVANWTAIFDGVFFIRNMTPSDKSK